MSLLKKRCSECGSWVKSSEGSGLWKFVCHRCRSHIAAEKRANNGAESSPAEQRPDAPISRPAPSRSVKAAGWYRDPSGKFDYRWFDGGWTEHVSNEGDDNNYTDPVQGSAGA